MSPGPVSDISKGPAADTPYVPAHCYPDGPKMCPCGHHEGYHDSQGVCLFRLYDFSRRRTRRHPLCPCPGLPPECFTHTNDIEGGELP